MTWIIWGLVILHVLIGYIFGTFGKHHYQFLIPVYLSLYFAVKVVHLTISQIHGHLTVV